MGVIQFKSRADIANDVLAKKSQRVYKEVEDTFTDMIYDKMEEEDLLDHVYCSYEYKVRFYNKHSETKLKIKYKRKD